MMILLVAIILIYAARIFAGIKNGLVKEIHNLIGFILIAACSAAAILMIGSFWKKVWITGLVWAIILVVLILARNIIMMILGLIGWIAKLPLINKLDKLMGAVAGAFEATLTVMVLIMLLSNLFMMIGRPDLMAQMYEIPFVDFLSSFLLEEV